jgi:ABC-2 type transport system permease protein
LVLAAIIFIATFQAGQMVFAAYDLPTASLTDADARRAMIGLVATAPVFPIIGVVAAFVLRSAAGAITLVLALLFVPGMFGALLPRRWQEDVLAYLPGSLADSVAMHHLDADNPLYADPTLAAVLLVVWIVVLIGGTWYLLNRRDV